MTTTSNNKRVRNDSTSGVTTAAKRMTASRTRPGTSKSSVNGAAEADKTNTVACSAEPGGTAISCCVQDELVRYFDMLDGEKPSGLYRMVIRQAEHALLTAVMRECGGNQSRAAEWLGISRGNLRNKLADME